MEPALKNSLAPPPIDKPAAKKIIDFQRLPGNSPNESNPGYHSGRGYE